ncbi:hypothetical protein AB0J80_30960 [Actinoplanes sp. NPDC049548]|uniref:hypothetical protein n=1 Tax=Actinoplanes sp. NPDC049548 TaxID=3155152 RepID=UPI00341EF0A6
MLDLDRYLDAGGTFIDTADCYEWRSRPGSRAGRARSCSAAGCAWADPLDAAGT